MKMLEISESPELALQRMSSPVSKLYHNEEAVYASCLNCQKHPKYPIIPAVTLHIDGICQNCGAFSGVEVSFCKN
jgi:hypothetical protein